VRAILIRHRLPPAPEQDGLSWRQLLRQQTATMLACDFLTVETVWLTRIYVLFFVSLERRRIEFIASTSNPDGRWVAQQARNLLMQLADRGQRFRILLHDRDSKFTGGLDEVFAAKACGSSGHPSERQNANAYAERWVGTLRRAIASSRLVSAPSPAGSHTSSRFMSRSPSGSFTSGRWISGRAMSGNGDLLRLLVSGVRRRLPAVSGRPAIQRPWVAAIARTMTAWPNG
jgi:hypothetical protein